MDSPYPRKRYGNGNSPVEGKILNHYCTLGKLKRMKNAIGEDAWQELKNSAVGVFLHLVDIEVTQKYVFSSHIVHYFLTQQLEVNTEHEFWSVIGGRPLRFSLHEYREITGLNCDPYPAEDGANSLEFEEFWRELNVCPGGGPNWEHLDKVLNRCHDWSFEKRMMLGRLCILHVGVYGIHHGSRIPLEDAKMVVHPERFETFPWGRKGFSCLVNSCKNLTSTGNTYTVNGCVHVLLIWVYESVYGIGELCGFKRGLAEVPPLLNWRGSRLRFNFEDLIANERARYGQVRVRQLIPEDVYPQWSENENNVDQKLEKLVHDILASELVPVSWDATKKVSKKRAFDDQTSKQQKEKKQKKDKIENVQKNEKKEKKEKENNVLHELFKIVKAVEEKMERSNEEAIQGLKRLDEKFNNFANSVKADFQSLRESAIEGGHHKQVEDVLSSYRRIEGQKDDGGSSEDTVKRADVASEKAPATGTDQTPVLTPLEIAKLMDKLQDEDKTAKDDEENMILASSSGDFCKENEKRKPKLAFTQKSPYVPNSTVKRIIPGVTPSTHAYDPMLPVCEEKWQRFVKWQEQYDQYDFANPVLFY